MNQNRDDCINLFNDILSDIDKSTIIEMSIYNYTNNKLKKNITDCNWDSKVFKRVYMNKCISLYNFLPKVLNDEICLEDIAFLTPQEVFPEHWKLLLDRKTASDEFLYTNKKIATTDQFKCGKCKKNECTHYQMQTRSADEPSTIFINCVNCGNSWKM
jgi:DNA-directed RNA polymerase subunit M/transcription elongation factor TFIIS